MIDESIAFKISVNRCYSREIEIVLLFLVAIIIVSVLTELLLLLIILGILSTILLVIDISISIAKNQKKIDIITFNPACVEVGKEMSFRIENVNIQKIVLRYSFTKGDQAKVRAMTGRENTVKIITKDGKKIIKNIWCETDLDYCRLKLLGEFLREKGIEVKMKGFNR